MYTKTPSPKTQASREYYAEHKRQPTKIADGCPSRAKPLKLLTCKVCGESFHHEMPNAATCSPKCKAARHRSFSRETARRWRAKLDQDPDSKAKHAAERKARRLEKSR